MNRAILLASALLLALQHVGEAQQIPLPEAGATHQLAIARPGQPDYLLVVEIPRQRVQGDQVHVVLRLDGGAPVRAVGVIKRGAAGPAHGDVLVGKITPKGESERGGALVTTEPLRYDAQTGAVLVPLAPRATGPAHIEVILPRGLLRGAASGTTAGRGSATATITLPQGHTAGLQIDGVTIRQIQEVSGVGRGELVLTRGITDGDRAPLRSWAARLGPTGSSARAREIVLEVYDPAGTLVQRYRLTNAWPKSLEIGTMKAGDTSAVAVERLTLAHEAIEPIR
jgi:hypothetical protein